MIKYIDGNILDIEKGLICHQVNCRGVMEAGLAKQLKDKYPEVFSEYKEFIYARKVHHIGGNQLLGAVNPVFINKDLIVINIFGQDTFGLGMLHTDYTAIEKAFNYIEQTVAPIYDLPVYIPYGFGCGLGGGNWDIVKGILEQIFKDSNITCTIIKLPT